MPTLSWQKKIKGLNLNMQKCLQLIFFCDDYFIIFCFCNLLKQFNKCNNLFFCFTSHIKQHHQAFKMPYFRQRQYIASYSQENKKSGVKLKISPKTFEKRFKLLLIYDIIYLIYMI